HVAGGGRCSWRRFMFTQRRRIRIRVNPRNRWIHWGDDRQITAVPAAEHCGHGERGPTKHLHFPYCTMALQRCWSARTAGLVDRDCRSDAGNKGLPPGFGSNAGPPSVAGPCSDPDYAPMPFGTNVNCWFATSSTRNVTSHAALGLAVTRGHRTQRLRGTAGFCERMTLLICGGVIFAIVMPKVAIEANSDSSLRGAVS